MEKNPKAERTTRGSNEPRFGFSWKLFLVFGWVIFLVLLCVFVVWHKLTNENTKISLPTNQPSITTPIPLPELSQSDQLGVSANRVLAVNGQLRVNSSLVLNPTTPPENPVRGEVYYDNSSNAPMYYDGEEYVAVATQDDVTRLQSASAQQSVRVERIVNNTTVTVSGPSDAAQTESPNTFTENNIFMQDIAVNGSTSLQSASIANLILGQPLSMASGGTGASALTMNGVIVGGASALTSVTASTTGLCLMSTNGAPSFQTCPTSGGVPSDIVTSATNTPGKIAKFGAGNTLVDSLLSEAGSVVSIAGALSLEGYDLQLGNNGFASTLNTTPLTANRTIMLPDASGTICLQSSASCGFAIGTAANYIQNQNSSQQVTTNFWISGTGRADTALQAPIFDTMVAGVLAIGGVNATSISLTQNTSLAAGRSLLITGGASGTRPAVPSEGMVYFDTTTKQLLVYANGKWQADRSNSNVLVAADDSRSKDSADFVVSSADEAAGNADATIAAAIASLPTSGGTVYLMEGTYTVDTGILLPSKTTVAGAGSNSTIIRLKNAHNANINVFDSNVTVKSNIRVQDLRIDGNKSNQTAGTQNGMYIWKVGDGTGATATAGVTLRDVEILNFRTHGVDMYDSENGRFENVRLMGNTGSGIYAHFNVFHTVFNSIEGSGNGAFGFRLDGGRYNKVTNSKFNSNGVGGVRTEATNTSENSFENNTAQSNTGYGFDIRYGLAGTYSNNYISLNTAGGIRLEMGIGANYTGATIVGNTITSNTGHGIEAARDVANATISSNRIYSNTGYGISLAGYLGSENPDNNAITGNYVYSNSTGGINLDQADDTLVQGNNIAENGGTTTNNGIRLVGYNSTNNSISGNVITDASCTTNCYAIYLGSPVGTTLSNNTLGKGTIFDTGTDTSYVNQVDVSGNLINRGKGALTVNTATASSSFTLQGGMTNSQLPSPAQPTVARVGTSGTTTYGYKITALDGTGETLPSVERTITNGNAILSATNYNTVTWVAVPGAVQYKIYRTSSVGTPASLGLIGTVSGSSITTFNDTGLAASAATPINNTTGGVSIAGTLQGSSATFASTLTVNGVLTSNSGAVFNGPAIINNVALIKTDSNTALQIQDTSSTQLFLADTSAMKITIRTLDVSYDLTVAGHVVSGGSTPTIAAGVAACTAPTVSVTGTDTAGTIVVTTGTGCGAAGIMSTTTFATAFGAAPRVTLTPASAATAGLNAYVDDASLTTGSFQVGAAAAPSDSTTYKWYYHALQ